MYASEIATSLVPPVETDAGLAVVIGTAPGFLVNNLANVNKPVLCYSYDEAVKTFGYSDDWKKYSLSEFIYSQFSLYGVAPCVLVNVFDPAKHFKVVEPHKFDVVASGINKSVNLGADVILSSVFIEDVTRAPEAGSTDPVTVTPELNRDYTVGYDAENNAVVSLLEDGAIFDESDLTIGYKCADVSQVTDADVIGGVDADGNVKGLELVNSVFAKFSKVPGLIAAPGWSSKPGIAAVMRAKAENINGLFSAMAVLDVPSDASGISDYTRVSEFKDRTSMNAASEIVCWPRVKLGNKVFNLSTQLVGLINKTDADNEDVPYKSPSNELLKMDAAVVGADNHELLLGHDAASYLNSVGVVTALSWSGGWKSFGNRTGIYPASTDPKDAFIAVRRMFNWIKNKFILTFWQKIDQPITPRLVQSIVNSFNVYLNGLKAREFILGGRVEFLTSENSSMDLEDGVIKFHVHYTPPAPTHEISAVFEYDPDYLSELFGVGGESNG